MTDARSAARRSVRVVPPHRRTSVTAVLGALLALTASGLGVAPARAEERSPGPAAELVATGVDGVGGLLAAGALLVLAGGLAILARRRTGPHPD